jgi:2-pyrone-4,6-dicarboxylate lactonase
MAVPACLSPHTDTGTPSFTVPPGACDAHMHVFGPADRFPPAAGRSYDPPPNALAEDFAALQAALGFERAVLVQAASYGTDNSAMLDAIAGSNGRWRGVAVIDAGFDADAIRVLDSAGVRGVRFGLVSHLGPSPDQDAMRRVVDAIAPFGWHAQFHIQDDGMDRYADFFDSLPVDVVIDHMGRVPAAGGLSQSPFLTLLDFVRRGKCWVKVSGVDRISATGAPYADAVPFAHTLMSANPDRCVWGTDWPHTNMKAMPRDEALVDLIPQIAPTPALQKKLLVDNPAALYGF